MVEPDQEQLLARRALASSAAEAGGLLAAGLFRRRVQVEWKSDDSPVTQADRDTEALIRQHIFSAYPDDGWIGEETDDVIGISGYRWIVDPIDGTRNFIRGVPLWATLVACEADTAQGPEVVAAAVFVPGLSELYQAHRGGGASCNGETIRVSTIATLAESLWCYETPGWFATMGLSQVFDQLCAGTALQRGLGDAYGHMLVASGRAELVIEPSLSMWDIAATSLIVREAGGAFTDHRGVATIRRQQAVVSNGLVHQQALQLLSPCLAPVESQP